MKEKVGRKQERRKLGKQEKEASEKRQRHRNERQKESTWIKKKKGRKEGREKERDCRKMKSEMRIFPPGVWFFKPPGGPWTLI